MQTRASERTWGNHTDGTTSVGSWLPSLSIHLAAAPYVCVHAIHSRRACIRMWRTPPYILLCVCVCVRGYFGVHTRDATLRTLCYDMT